MVERPNWAGRSFPEVPQAPAPWNWPWAVLNKLARELRQFWVPVVCGDPWQRLV